MASPRGFAVALLAVAGALSGHWIGTTLAAPAELVDHSYLGFTGAILTPFAIMALGWLALKGARTTGVADLDLRLLLAVQVAVFVGQESIELSGAGLSLSSFVTEPAIVVGLLAQLPVALLIRALVRLAGKVAAAWLTPGTLPTTQLLGRPAQGQWLPLPVPVRVRGPRGPPRLR